MRVIIFLFAVLGIGACQLQRQPTNDEIQGLWQVYDVQGYPTVVVEFDAEGHFNVRQNIKNKPTLWGQYYYQEGVLKLINEGGRYSDRCRDTGSYSLFLSEDLLEFVSIKDECPARKYNTQSPWQKIPQ